MELILAALAGVLVASGMMAYYNQRAQQKQLRSATTIDIISWADDVYDRLITIQAEREATFTGTPFGLSTEEFRTTVKEVKSMLLATKTRAKVLLVYGEGAELMKFDSLHDEFITVTDRLLKSTKESWQAGSEEINERFSRKIEPLIRELEAMLISGARNPGGNRTLLMPSAPRLYLPHAGGDAVVHPAGAAVVKGRGPTLALAPYSEALISALRVILILAILGIAAWLASGRPDLSALYRQIPVSVGPDTGAAPLPLLDLCIDTPATYGIASAAEFEPIKPGAVLTVRPGELPLKLRIRNNTRAPLANAVFMLSIPHEVTTAKDQLWKSWWQEILTRSGRRLVLNITTDIPPDGTAQAVPYPEIRLPAPGDYVFSHTTFADGLAPRSGHFIIRVSE